MSEEYDQWVAANRAAIAAATEKRHRDMQTGVSGPSQGSVRSERREAKRPSSYDYSVFDFFVHLPRLMVGASTAFWPTWGIYNLVQYGHWWAAAIGTAPLWGSAAYIGHWVRTSKRGEGPDVVDAAKAALVIGGTMTGLAVTNALAYAGLEKLHDPREAVQAPAPAAPKNTLIDWDREQRAATARSLLADPGNEYFAHEFDVAGARAPELARLYADLLHDLDPAQEQYTNLVALYRFRNEFTRDLIADDRLAAVDATLTKIADLQQTLGLRSLCQAHPLRPLARDAHRGLARTIGNQPSADASSLSNCR